MQANVSASTLRPTWKLNQPCVNLLSSVSLAKTPPGLTAGTLRQLAITMVNGYCMTGLANSLARQLADTLWNRRQERVLVLFGNLISGYSILLLAWPLLYGNNCLTLALFFMKMYFENWCSECISEMTSGLWNVRVWADRDWQITLKTLSIYLPPQTSRETGGLAGQIWDIWDILLYVLYPIIVYDFGRL